MKKYITLAALLAAGTACANAEDILYDYATASDKDMSKNGWTYGGSYSTGQSSYVGVMDAANSTFNSATGKRDAWRFCDGSTSGPAIWASKSMADAELFKSGAFSAVFNIQLDTTSYYTSGANGSSNFYNKAGSVESMSLVVGDGTGVYWAKFGYNGSSITVTDCSNNTVSAIDLEWNTMTDITFEISADDGTAKFLVGESVVTLGRSTNLGNYKSSIIVGTVSAADQGNMCVSSVKLVAIPEPSAFGLLAGVGALAFVASRRRRR